MSDVLVAQAETTGVSERLTLEAGILAGRLAHFLATALPSDDGTISGGRRFLEAFFASVAGDQTLESFSRNPLERACPGETHPLDRLINSLKLTPAEFELFILAGLSEEHEGLSAVLRSLHPRSEPRATVGLAAQLLHNDPNSRRAFRNAVDSSALVKSGALRLTGDGPILRTLVTTR